MTKKKNFKRSYKKKPETPIHRRRWFWLAVALPTIAIVFVYLLTSSIFRVNEIEIIGVETLNPNEILPIIEEGIVSNLFFLKSKSIFLINESKISEKLTNKFPEINLVRVKKSFPQSIVVTVVERSAVASWCPDYGKCFLIDKKGVLFKEVPDTVRLAVIKGGDSATSLSGTPISPDEMRFIIETWRGLKDIIELVVFDVSDPDLVVQTSEGWDARFTLTDSARVQTEKLNLVLKNTIPKERRADLDYIDVRFENRAYFKYRGAIAN